MISPIIRARLARNGFPLVSGILYGLSYPSNEHIWLEPLAWFCLLPWLYSIRCYSPFYTGLARGPAPTNFDTGWAGAPFPTDPDSNPSSRGNPCRGANPPWLPFWLRVPPAHREVATFREYATGAFLFTFIGHLIVGWSALYAHLLGGAFALFVNWIVITLPLILLYPVIRSWGWKWALPALPFLWVAVDWFYMHQPLCLPWYQFGHSQARLTWLIQFADLFGVWGVTFWLVLFNALLALALFPENRPAEKSIPLVLLVLVFILMVGLPAGYSLHKISTPKKAGNRPDPPLKVALVQPNFPWGYDDSAKMREARLTRHISETDKAMKKTAPDLIVWPENAMLLMLRFDLAGRNRVLQKVAEWETPLVTNTFDASFLSPGESGGPLLTFLGRRFRMYNTAVLLTPQLAEFTLKNHPDTYLPIKAYHKRKLFPFTEFVPFSDRIPFLAHLLIEFNKMDLNHFEPGDEPTTFKFRERKGRKVTLGAMICSEELYPSVTAELASAGAQMIALLTDDSIFGSGPVVYQFAQFGRLRAIETRRYIARAGNTDNTFVIDPFGRISGALPRFTEGTSLGKVLLSRNLTFFVRHPDLVPKISLIVAGLILLCSAATLRWGELGNRGGLSLRGDAKTGS